MDQVPHGGAALVEKGALRQRQARLQIDVAPGGVHGDVAVAQTSLLHGDDAEVGGHRRGDQDLHVPVRPLVPRGAQAEDGHPAHGPLLGGVDVPVQDGQHVPSVQQFPDPVHVLGHLPLDPGHLRHRAAGRCMAMMMGVSGGRWPHSSSSSRMEPSGMRSRFGGGIGRLTNRGVSRHRKRTPLWVKAKSREPGAGDPGKRWRRKGPS